jgi:hypothetical protein
MVILDVKTRWNSTFDMLVRARELKEVSLIFNFSKYSNNIKFFIYLGFKYNV